MSQHLRIGVEVGSSLSSGLLQSIVCISQLWLDLIVKITGYHRSTTKSRGFSGRCETQTIYVVANITVSIQELKECCVKVHAAVFVYFF